MHPYLMEQQIKARNEDLHRELARPGRKPVRRRPRPSPRHTLGWLLVGVGLRLALGRAGARDAISARAGGGPVITAG
jgi:hypothetical protein